MNCSNITELMDQYIFGELSQAEKAEFEMHIAACEACSTELTKTRAITEKLRSIKSQLIIKEDIMSINRRNIMKRSGHVERKARRPISAAAVCILLVLFTAASSLIAFPALAARFTPQLPVVRELLEVKEENKVLLQIKEQNEQIQQKMAEIEKENEQLKIQIKEISGEKIKEVQTSAGVTPEENTAIQELTVNFIKAQYRGDLAAIKSVATEKYLKQIEKEKNSLLKNNSGAVVFSQITNVAKENDVYMVFIRISDSTSDSEYQENFEIKKVNGKFLVDFMGMDA